MGISDKIGTVKRNLRINPVSWFMMRQESSIIIAVLLLMFIATYVNPMFLSSTNMFNVVRSAAFTLIPPVGMTFVLITAGLDLSIGSVIALGGVVTGMLLDAGVGLSFSIMAGILAGTVVGCINGFIIVKGKIPPLITTLGMQYACRGLVSAMTRGVPIWPLPEQFTNIAAVQIGPLPSVVVIAVIIAILGQIVLSKTAYGRSVYAVGGNAESARISGINTRKVTFSVYVITSTLAALTGILLAARLGSAEATSGSGYELIVICSAVIGGTSTFGGMGTVIGALIGTMFMEMLSNSLTLMRISVFYRELVIGGILVGAVLLDQYRRNWIFRKSIMKSKS